MTHESSELKIIHERIENDLKNIKDILTEVRGQTTKTNGRVGVLEDELITAKRDIADALKIISGHSTIISYYKTEADKARDNLISEQEKKIEKMESDNQAFNKRVMYTTISVVIFILVTLGLVDKDLIKVLVSGV
jgi:chromosome segregation ATPase